MRLIRVMRLSAAGAALSLILGSSLVATVSDSVTSRNNRVSSGTDAYDIRMFNHSRGELIPCPREESAYESPSRSPSISATLSGGATVARDICVRNFAAATTGALALGFLNVVDAELACSPGEAEAGDVSCRPAGQGELSGTLGVQIVFRAGDCFDPDSSQAANRRDLTFRELATGLVDLGVELGSNTCRLTMQLKQFADLAPDARERAQTDSVQWDLTFVLRDPQPRPSEPM